MRTIPKSDTPSAKFGRFGVSGKYRKVSRWMLDQSPRRSSDPGPMFLRCPDLTLFPTPIKEHSVEANKSKKVFIAPDDGAHLPVLDIVHKITAKDSGGSLTIEEWGLPPGMMIPPHTHTREDECNFVLEGELTCDVGGEIVVAPVGSYVLKPRNVPHALCNTGTEPVWVVEILTPGGFESYFDEYEEIASKLASGEIGEEEHLRARAELGDRYGVIWHDERIPEARARFGLEP
jgi:quercetin dioxygenase-like cupin family protein